MVMGIKSFSQIIAATSYSDTPLHYYDALLIDIQHALYLNIRNSILHTGCSIEDIADRLCAAALSYVGESLAYLLSKSKHSAHLTVIIAFDGKGVPMKWPTQCERRKDNVITSNKQLVLTSLFEHNTFSKCVYDYLIVMLNDTRWLNSHFFQYVDNMPATITFYVSGSNKDGEGEHKAFQLAKRYNCQHILVYSVDNDVFIISFIRRRQFKSIQITKNTQKFFCVNTFLRDFLKYDVQKLIYASLLFGNDFIPEYIALADHNAFVIHDILGSIDSSDCIVQVLHQLVVQLHERNKIQFKLLKRKIQNLTHFWINCLWILDYYDKESFPQKFIENRFYFMTDRDSLLSFLYNFKGSRYCYDEARKEYDDIAISALPESGSARKVYSGELLERVEPFLIQRDISPYMSKIVWTNI